MESRLLERRQRVVAEKGTQREGWKERRQRRRPERRRKRRRSEEGRQEEVRDASLGAPGWELEDLDGSSWTPSPGEPLDCDLKNDAEEKIDAINYSTTPQVGDALEQPMLWRSLEEDSSRDAPGRPASEGLLQTTAKGLQNEIEDEKGGVNSSPGCGSVAESGPNRSLWEWVVDSLVV